MNRMRVGVVALGFSLPVLLGAGRLARDEDLRKSIEELKKVQQDILKELADIKQLQARAQPAAPDVAGKIFTLGDNPMKKVHAAKLTLVEFSDCQ